MTTRATPPRAQLPEPRVALLGREQERARLRAVFTERRARLVSLTGPPGVGKTLLAEYLARDLHEQFAGGAAFVALDTVREPQLVPEVVATALGLQEEPGRTPTESLHQALRNRDLLIVLDNFEQLIAATQFVGDLLDACPPLTLLVTSRIGLGLRGELLAPVAPLPLPTVRTARQWLDDAAGSASAAMGSPAMELFAARARAVQPTLALSAATAPAIAEICRRLDGLPLAIELAAARAKLFTPREIAERLEHRLAFLTGGYRDLPPRQRTLRAAIDWSHDLLSPAEQRLFRVLSAFPGGCTLAALAFAADHGEAEEDSDPADEDALVDILGALIDHSLVRRWEDRTRGSRFGMLETIREYAAEQLESSGDGEEVRVRLATWCVTFAQRAGRELIGAGQAASLEFLEEEHPNLRAVLRWTLEHEEPRLGLELAASLWRFWLARGYLSEGRRWLESLVQAGPHTPSLLRATALFGAATIAEAQADYAACARLADGCLALSREAGGREAADALLMLAGLAYRRSEYATATAYCEECLALAQAEHEPRLLARCLNMLGLLSVDQGLFARADQYFEQALPLAREASDLRTTGIILNNLGLNAHRRDDLAQSQRYLEQSVSLHRQRGDRVEVVRSLATLAMVLRGRDELAEALLSAREALALAEEMGNQYGVMTALSQLTPIVRAQGDLHAAHRYMRTHLQIADESDYPLQILSALSEAATNARVAGRPRRAVRLHAAAEALREAMGLAQHPGMQRQLESELEELQQTPALTTFAADWAEGSAMSRSEAVAYALVGAGDGERAATAGVESKASLGALDVRRRGVPGNAPDAQPARARSAGGAQATPAAEPPDRLTARQLEVLRLVAAGESNEVIAARLVISERTVEHHISNIYRRIDVNGRVEATAYAHRHGLVQ